MEVRGWMNRFPSMARNVLRNLEENRWVVVEAALTPH